MTKLKTIVSISAPILFIISTILNLIDIANAFSKVLIPIMFLSSLAVLAFAIYFIKYRNAFNLLRNENKNLKETIHFLKNEICDGVHFFKNDAHIFFDIGKKQYNFKFVKIYTILTDNIKWFPVQFYCNKILKDSEESRKFYSENPVKLEDLKFYAQLKFKNDDELDFSRTRKLGCLLVSDGDQFKQLHIQYKTDEGDDLGIRKGARIELEYGYTIPVQYWGSYLNRRISYFGEDSNIFLECRSKNNIQNSNMKLFKIDHKTGNPNLISNVSHKFDQASNNFISKIKLPSNKSSVFRLWWDANIIFNENNLTTENTYDHTQLTRY